MALQESGHKSEDYLGLNVVATDPQLLDQVSRTIRARGCLISRSALADLAAAHKVEVGDVVTSPMGGGERFCRGCGRLSTAAGDSCPLCGTSLCAPAIGQDDLRGLTLEYSRLGQTRNAVVLNAANEKLLVVRPGGKLDNVARSKTSRLDPDDSAASVRMWKLHERGGLWRSSDLDDHLGDLVEDLAQARALARHAVASGSSSCLTAARLTANEHLWAAAHLAWHRGDRDETADSILGLPTGTYADLDLLAAVLWTDAKLDEGRRQALRGRLELSTDATWGQVFPLLEGEGAEFEVVCSTLDAVAAQWVEPEDRLRQVVRAMQAPGAEAIKLGGPIATRAAALGVRCTPEQLGAAAIEDAPLEVLDELIETSSGWRSVGWLADRVDDRRYLRARIDPSTLEACDVAELGIERESFRRAVLSGDERAFESQKESADPEILGLCALRDGQTAAVSELATLYSQRPDERRRTLVLAYGQWLATGKVDGPIAEDRSSWPLIGTMAVQPDPPSDVLKPLLSWSALRGSLEAIWQGKWPEACELAKHALAASPDEATSDESRNLLACALWMMDDQTAAAAALAHAVEGEHNINLQTNFALVAGASGDDGDKWAASRELARVADDAGRFDQSLNALWKAVGLWNEIPAGTEQGDRPPEELISVLRRFATEQTDEEEHDRIMAFLSWSDSGWLADRSNTASSQWSASHRHAYRCARAQGPAEGIVAMRKLFADSPAEAEREWARAELASTCEGLVSSLVDRDEPSIGLAMWAFDFCDAGLPIDEALSFRMTVMGVDVATRAVVADGDGYPSESLWSRLDAAVARYDKSPILQEALDRDTVEFFVNNYARRCTSPWVAVHDQVVEAVNGVRSRLATIPARRIDRSAVRKNTAPIIEAIHETDVYMHSVRTRVTDSDVAGFMDKIRASLARMRSQLEVAGR